METILLVVHVFIALALIGLVLLQRSESDGFGLGSGSGMNLMSGRASANFLTKATSVVAAIFIANSLLLSILAANRGSESIVDTIEAIAPADVKTEAPSTQTPAEPLPQVPQEAGEQDTKATSAKKESVEPVQVPVAE